MYLCDCKLAKMEVVAVVASLIGTLLVVKERCEDLEIEKGRLKDATSICLVVIWDGWDCWGCEPYQYTA